MKKMFLKIAVIAVNKVTGPRSFFIKKETLAQAFSCEFWEISKNTYLSHPGGNHVSEAV